MALHAFFQTAVYEASNVCDRLFCVCVLGLWTTGCQPLAKNAEQTFACFMMVGLTVVSKGMPMPPSRIYLSTSFLPVLRMEWGGGGFPVDSTTVCEGECLSEMVFSECL